MFDLDLNCMLRAPILGVVIATAAFGQAVGPVAPSERIINLDTRKDELKQYHDCTCKCGCYSRDLNLQADRAIAFLRKRAERRRPDEKLVLVLDIDETTLSNYEQMVRAGFAYDSNAFHAWVESQKAPAIPGTLRLFNEARQRGFGVFFITGRSDTERAATEQNLRAQGFDGWQELVMRTPEQKSLSAVEYKSAARGRLWAKGYSIALNVGDQWSDLRGENAAEYSVKYPDPYYFLR